METYQIFVFLMVNEKITEELEFRLRAWVLKYQAREYWGDKEAPKDSVAPSDNIEKAKDCFVSPSAEIDKTTK